MTREARRAEQSGMPFREPTCRERELAVLLARIDRELALGPGPVREVPAL